MNRLAEFTKGELLKLVTQKWIGRVTVGITEAIEHSFNTDEVLRPVHTRDEIERRFEICIRWFCTLRRDLHWSVPRILDEMPRILRYELDHDGGWSPDEDRTSWTGKGDKDTPIELQDDGGEDLAPDVPEVKDAIEVGES